MGVFQALLELEVLVVLVVLEALDWGQGVLALEVYYLVALVLVQGLVALAQEYLDKVEKLHCTSQS